MALIDLIKEYHRALRAYFDARTNRSVEELRALRAAEAALVAFEGNADTELTEAVNRWKIANEEQRRKGGSASFERFMETERAMFIAAGVEKKADWL